MATQNPAKTLARQQRRHPDLVSLEAGQLIRYRAIEQDIQRELPPWQRRHTDPPVEPSARVGRQQRERGAYTRQLLNRPHDHWPVRSSPLHRRVVDWASFWGAWDDLGRPLQHQQDPTVWPHQS